MKKKKKTLFLGIIILIIILVIFGVYDRMKHTSKEGIRVNIYQQGKETKLNPESDYFADIQKRSESLFANANDALLLAVTSQTISKAKEGTAVEIIYSKPKEMAVGPASTSVMKIDALLVEFGSKNVTIYYSVNGSYSAGPYVNTNEEKVNELKGLLQNIN